MGTRTVISWSGGTSHALASPELALQTLILEGGGR